MAASFSAVKAPPQTLERLDTWGTLDKLPWSLDDAVWTKAGEYALTISEAGRSGQTITLVRKKVIVLSGAGLAAGTAVRTTVRLLSGNGTGKSGDSIQVDTLQPVYLSPAIARSGEGTLAADRIRTEIAAGTGTGGALIEALRIRQDDVEEAAESAEAASPVRARLLDMTGGATGGQSEIFLRVTPLLVTEPAESGEELWPFRVRVAPLSGVCAGGEAVTLVRVRCVEPDPANATGAGQIRPEYKGWGWDVMARMDQAWEPVPMQAQGWRRLPDGNTEWLGIVEWQ